jgi:hypothetical protein
MRTHLQEIPDMLAELGLLEDVLRDLPRTEKIGGEERTVHYDPVASVVPAGMVPGPGHGGRVSGSRERPLVIRVDAHDLAMPARVLPPYGEDQVGHPPIATVLDGWVRDWRTHRSRGEGLPEPTVKILSDWLLTRLDDACDDHPAIDEFSAALRQIHGALRAQLGMVEVPDYKVGVPCRGCDRITLYRSNGSDYVECGSCPSLLSPDDYTRWTGLVSAAAASLQKKAKAS